MSLVKKWIEPSPFPLIKNGEIMYKGLGKARITVDHLLSEARKEKIEEVHKISLALWELDHTISFFLSPQLQPVTPKDLHLKTEQFSIPSIIIKEGKIDLDGLQKSAKDTTWLKNKLEIMNVDVRDILLATIDTNDDFIMYLYN